MKVLFVIDCLNDFFTGSLGSEHCQTKAQNIANRIEYAYKNSELVVIINDTHHDSNYLETREGKHLPIKHCIVGTDGMKYIPEIKSVHSKLNVQTKDYLSEAKPFERFCLTFDKEDRFGLDGAFQAWFEEELVELPEEEEYTFEFIGVATNICVLSCAVSIQNMFPNIEIEINAECCASFIPEMHEKALDIMEGLHMKVINR